MKLHYSKKELIQMAYDIYNYRPFDKWRGGKIEKFNSLCEYNNFDRDCIAWTAKIEIKLNRAYGRKEK